MGKKVPHSVSLYNVGGSLAFKSFFDSKKEAVAWAKEQDKEFKKLNRKYRIWKD